MTSFEVQANNFLSRRTLLMGAGGVALLSSLAACTGDSPTPGEKQAAGKPKRGGNFRVGVTGGGADDRIDPDNILSVPEVARGFAGWETLVILDSAGKLENALAKNIEIGSASKYTIELRKDVEFHNGKTMTADDLIYTLQRIGDKANGLSSYDLLSAIDFANLKKRDQYTVEIPLTAPDSTLLEKFAFSAFVVPEGYEAYSDDPSTQIGTGCYKLESFTRGEQSVHVRNDNYWRGDGSPWFDQVTIINFTEPAAQVNALLAGQIDAMTGVPTPQVETVKSQGKEIVITKNGFWVPLCMNIEKAPFDDERVRQAFRLIVDRQQMLDQVYSGLGDIGNDVSGIYEASYNSELPQRDRDIDEAKALLKAAGQENLTVDLYTTNGATGMVSIASAFATQAKDAGVTVNVKNLPSSTFYGDGYLEYAFSVDFWSPTPYLATTAYGTIPGAPFNETHWPPESGEGSEFLDLYQQALAEVDVEKRTELIHAMQELEYNLGGYIIPAFPTQQDAHAANVRGFESPAATLRPLNNYGRGFRTIWFE